jgi:hypothetical protein
MTSSVVVLGVFVLLVPPTSDLLASLSTLLNPALVLQRKRTSKRHTRQVVFTGFRIRIRLIQIRIQHFRLNTDPDPIRIQGLYDQNFNKFTAENKIKFFFDQKLYLPIPKPP